MAQLAAVFPALNIQPEVYYKLLEDLREDAFLGGVRKICLEVTDLFPNSNLVAIVREKSQEFYLEKMKNQRAVEDDGKLLTNEPSYEEIEKNKKEWNELKEKLAKAKGIK